MSLGRLTSEAPPMREALRRVDDVAAHVGGVLLRGEYGSGRETIVREVHRLSRPNRPFVVVDVPGIPPELLESLLFGHEYSTFTGSHVVKRGVFETAESGTVLIREIGAMPYDLQPKVLRVFERREFRRVGSNTMQRFNGRIFSTTHCALEELVSIHWFRPELLAAIAFDADVTLPPLRERMADLPALLAGHHITLDTALLQRLSRLQWRGNFHQLESFARKLAALAPADAVTELELLEAIEDNPADDGPRLVYGDQLVARGDLRGELIQMQCRLAAAGPDRNVRAAERVLLESHHKGWVGTVEEVASTPAVQSQATLSRGFVHQLTLEAPVLRRIDAVLRAAPLLEEVIAQGDLASDCLVSPLLRRIRSLAFAFANLGAPDIATLAACPYLTGLRHLGVTTGAPADGELRQIGIEALATSPHLANLTSLVLDVYELTADNLATLLDTRARWTLAELAIEPELQPTDLEVLVAAPKASGLRVLDLRTTPIRAASAIVLAGATSLSNLTTLWLSRLDADAREILLASSTLAGATIYDGKQAIR